ncbi:ACT domain-containing protein [Crenothrix polyspora]|uniref:Uncharacterized protein n=1 Tax=Crenothrix polyspora TaxID=360316 RepID=A0A1R4HIP0_9GAMM|nr:ACT domain-containing protein [Crenothrix polyspora]SJM96104.1 conserved hypothetical protein [Crenothrix polyspora]
MTTQRTLTLLPEDFAICRLDPDAVIPDWAIQRPASFFVITQTQEELSVICPQQRVPDDAKAHRNWRCLKLEGTFDLDEPGIIAALVNPLAQAGIAVFVEATYDTDYLLVNQIDNAILALEKLGHRIVQ